MKARLICGASRADESRDTLGFGGRHPAGSEEKHLSPATPRPHFLARGKAFPRTNSVSPLGN